MRLHFVLGAWTADTLREAFPGDRIAFNQDVFTEGPCRFVQNEGTEPWLEARRAWWRRRLHQPECDEEAGDARELADALAGWSAFEDVVIWSADAVAEQLFACWLVSELGPHAPPTRIWHGRPTSRAHSFTSVSLHTPSELRGVEPRRVESPEMCGTESIWSAYLNPTPARFSEAVTAPSPPPLADRLAHLLPRFPDKRDGLTAWERYLLVRVQQHQGETTARTIGSVLGSKGEETPDFIGDMTLFDLMVELATAGLLEMNGDGKAMRDTRFTLTALGRDVLEGRANRVAAAGFDRWIGGTHLDAARGGLWWFVESSLDWAPVPERMG